MTTKTQNLDPLKQALADTINKLTNGVEKGIDFFNAQMPEVIEQLLIWKIWESAMQCIVGFLILFACWKLPSMVWKKYKFPEWNEEKQLVVIMIGSLGLIFAGIAVSILINFKWLQILIAPKIYLIEYAAELLK